MLRVAQIIIHFLLCLDYDYYLFWVQIPLNQNKRDYYFQLLSKQNFKLTILHNQLLVYQTEFPSSPPIALLIAGCSFPSCSWILHGDHDFFSFPVVKRKKKEIFWSSREKRKSDK